MSSLLQQELISDSYFSVCSPGDGGGGEGGRPAEKSRSLLLVLHGLTYTSYLIGSPVIILFPKFNITKIYTRITPQMLTRLILNFTA